MVFIFTQFSENILNGFSYGADTILILKNKKGYNSVNKTTLGVTVLVLCRLSNDGLHLYQVSCKYLERFQLLNDTMSILFITKGHNSVNIAHRVLVLVSCISSDHGPHLFQVS